MQFPKAISVKAIEKYKIQVAFDDGLTGLLDLHHFAGKGVFKIWDEGDNFNKVFISDDGDITWPGELDIDTINAYCNIKGITPDEFFTSLQEYAPNK